ncbi:TRAP transporter small permease [Desulfopila sp. IMCC35006]|uniref:TRAP transporter small permease n=1 Tax=Desulfopila sp. IMCC35006 TaxID=2569542 RepID=UPI0010AC39EA|nr:TRAP transporter small permease [Desulfopila sp. IMCC35006]TKB28232.1 TRAP transporter small permease [Desulfopila sp. IMCC35006]
MNKAEVKGPATADLSFIEKVSSMVNTLVEHLLVVTGAAICLILFAQVIWRYLGSSLGWSEEVSRHLLVTITFLGSTAAYKRANFIGLRGVGQWFGPNCERIILVFLQVLTFTCFTALSWFGVMYTVKAWHHSTASLQIPMAIPFAVIPLATAILVLHTAADMVRTVRGRKP